MKSYIKDNYSKVMGVINLMVDSNPNTEIQKEWKSKVLFPYIQSLSDLEIIKKYGWVDNSSLLKEHCDFIDKITTICEKSNGNDLPLEKFNKHLNQMISNWLDCNLDSVLYQAEKDFYVRIAWQDEPLDNEDKKDTPLQKKKMEASIMMNKRNKINF